MLPYHRNGCSSRTHLLGTAERSLLHHIVCPGFSCSGPSTPRSSGIRWLPLRQAAKYAGPAFSQSTDIKILSNLGMFFELYLLCTTSTANLFYPWSLPARCRSQPGQLLVLVRRAVISPASRFQCAIGPCSRCHLCCYSVSSHFMGNWELGTYYR